MPSEASTRSRSPGRRGRIPASSDGRATRGARDAAAAAPETRHRAEDRAYDAISKALLEGKLRPNTPLRERYLAEVFGTTRGAVRKVLLRLGHEGKLAIFPNRGAYVPQPSGDDIKQAYDARKAVEVGLVTLLASRIQGDQLAHLRSHVSRERHAQRRGHRETSVTLAGAFHVELVHALGNPELGAIVGRLVARTRMFVALFEPARDSGCAPDEHEAIVAALASRDGSRAAAAMLDHLQRVEARIHEHLNHREPPALADILRSALAPRQETR
jgi:DNA-binding GntR family transcriptional regulator